MSNKCQINVNKFVSLSVNIDQYSNHIQLQLEIEQAFSSNLNKLCTKHYQWQSAHNLLVFKLPLLSLKMASDRRCQNIHGVIPFFLLLNLRPWKHLRPSMAPVGSSGYGVDIGEPTHRVFTGQVTQPCSRSHLCDPTFAIPNRNCHQSPWKHHAVTGARKQQLIWN